MSNTLLNELIIEYQNRKKELECKLEVINEHLAYLSNLQNGAAKQPNPEPEANPEPIAEPTPPKKERVCAPKAAVFGEPKPRPRGIPRKEKKIKTQTAIFRMVLAQYYKVGDPFQYVTFLHRSRIAAEKYDVSITEASCSKFVSDMFLKNVLTRYHTGEYARII